MTVFPIMCILLWFSPKPSSYFNLLAVAVGFLIGTTPRFWFLYNVVMVDKNSLQIMDVCGASWSEQFFISTSKISCWLVQLAFICSFMTEHILVLSMAFGSDWSEEAEHSLCLPCSCFHFLLVARSQNSTSCSASCFILFPFHIRTSWASPTAVPDVDYVRGRDRSLWGLLSLGNGRCGFRWLVTSSYSSGSLCPLFWGAFSFHRWKWVMGRCWSCG